MSIADPPPQGAAGGANPYHHGDLRRVLIDAALKLAEKDGTEAVSVREAARRAGVSPGAPFQHFDSRAALMTAVAEEARRRFRARGSRPHSRSAARDPLLRFRALGLASSLGHEECRRSIISSHRASTIDAAAEAVADDSER